MDVACYKYCQFRPVRGQPRDELVCTTESNSALLAGSGNACCAWVGYLGYSCAEVKFYLTEFWLVKDIATT